VVHLACYVTQDLYSTDISDVNKSQSWSLPSLSFLRADLTCLDMYIWLVLLTACLHSDEIRYNLINWWFWLLNILNLLSKSNHKWLQMSVLSRVRSENFQNNVSGNELACRWTWGMNVNLDTFEATLSSYDKVVVTWLRCEK